MKHLIICVVFFLNMVLGFLDVDAKPVKSRLLLFNKLIKFNFAGGVVDRLKKRDEWEGNNKRRLNKEEMDTLLGIEVDSNLFLKNYSKNKYVNYITEGLRLKLGYEYVKTKNYYTNPKSYMSLFLAHRIFDSVIKLEPGILYKFETSKTLANRETINDRVDILLPILNNKLDIGIRLDNKIFQSQNPSTVLFLLSYSL